MYVYVKEINFAQWISLNIAKTLAKIKTTWLHTQRKTESFLLHKANVHALFFQHFLSAEGFSLFLILSLYMYMYIHRLTNLWPLDSRSNWNWCCFCGGRKTGEPREELSEQGKNQQQQTLLSPCQISGRQVLSPLHQLCFLWNEFKHTFLLAAACYVLDYKCRWHHKWKEIITCINLYHAGKL